MFISIEQQEIMIYYVYVYLLDHDVSCINSTVVTLDFLQVFPFPPQFKYIDLYI